MPGRRITAARGAALALAIAGAASAAPAQVGLPEPARVRVDFSSTAILSKQASGEAGVVGRKVAADDPVRVASISKLVTAIAVMRLVD